MPDTLKTRQQDDPWVDLVVSILSVNQYSLERTYGALEGLRRENLTEPSTLARSDTDEIERRLVAAGCDRGKFMTKLFSVRLASLGVAVEALGIPKCTRILQSSDRKAISDLLMPVNGIGPKVIRNFLMLRGLD